MKGRGWLWCLLAMAALAAARAVPASDLRGGLPCSQAVFDARGRLLRLTLAVDGRYRLWLPLEDIAPSMEEAVLLQEDRWFYRHPGVNPAALLGAAYRTYVRRGRRVGGSTITMQVARLRYRIRSTTPFGKALQILRALQIESRHSKREILEAYLNLVPLGGNVEGVGAASLLYFGKEASRLSVPEALALAVIPQSPARRGPLAAGLSEAPAAPVRDARGRLMARWLRVHPGDTVRSAETAALAPRVADPPFVAPHFVEAMVRDHPDRPLLRTTLDIELQELLERQLQAYVAERRDQGIRNAAALLLDARGMEVRAAVGSADYRDASIQGQVNGWRAKRSPGSALKPFIYALGIDQGLVHSLTVLKDAPTSFGGYDPENFDRDFVGPVSVQEALVRSRNVPAVLVASKLSSPTLYGFLTAAGVPDLEEESHYGLTLVLGGAEMTMEDLVRLYGMLANGGELRPLRTLVGDSSTPGTRLLSPDAVFMVLQMLKTAQRPDARWRPEWTRDRLDVYWKTGTSYGYRDAWCFGLFGPYVLGVWTGNFDGEGDPALVGIEAAAPLFFRVVDAMRARPGFPRDPPYWAPQAARRVRACALSGAIPGPHCARTAWTWFIPGKSPIKTCDIHRAILVDSLSGRRACRPGPGVREEVFEFWPSDILRIFRQAGMPRRPLPPLDPECSTESNGANGSPPQISSPAGGVEIELRAGAAGRQPVPLAAVTDAGVREVHWFVGQDYLGRAPADKPLLWRATPGRFVVRAVDDQGRSDAREVRVVIVR